MPSVNIKPRLYEEIIRQGYRVPEFVNEAVAEVLYRKIEEKSKSQEVKHG
jgi:hypothetical protein